MELTQKAFLARRSGSVVTGLLGPGSLPLGKDSVFLVHLFVPGFPGGTSSKEPSCQCGRQKRRGFDPWVRKIP